MTLRRRTGNLQTYIDDETGTLHLVHVSDGVVTDIVAYQQPDVVAAIEAMQTALIPLLPQDSHVGALENVDYQSVAAHDGKAFLACYMDTAVGDTEIVTLRLVVPAAKHMHLFLDVKGIFETSWELFEDTTHSAGTELTAYNRDRNSALEATMTVTHTVSGGNDGTRICAGAFGSGKSGGGMRAEVGWVLDQGKVYLLKATSHKVANLIAVIARWNEED